MQFSFPRKFSRSAFFSLVALMSALASAQQAPEASHRERFAPRSQALQRAEKDLDARIAGHPDDARLLSDRGLLRLDLNKQDEALADLRKSVDLQPDDSQLH